MVTYIAHKSFQLITTLQISQRETLVSSFSLKYFGVAGCVMSLATTATIIHRPQPFW